LRCSVNSFAATMVHTLRLFAVACMGALRTCLSLREREGRADGHLTDASTSDVNDIKSDVGGPLSDPFTDFDLFGKWAPSTNGCTSSGEWKGTYSIANGAIQILTISVGPSDTTFEFFQPLAQEAKRSAEKGLVEEWVRMEGPHANQEVADMFCRAFQNPSQPGSIAFRLALEKACNFWSSSSLQYLCQDPFKGVELFGTWEASPSNGCTSTGWSGQYSKQGKDYVLLKVDIDGSSTSFKWWDQIAARAKGSGQTNKLASWFRMEEPQSNAMVAEFFCGNGWSDDLPPSWATGATSMAKSACGFWSSLDSQCPSLSGGR